MTPNIDADNTVALHFRDLRNSNPDTYGNVLVKHRLGELGTELVLVSGSEAYDTTNRSVSAKIVPGRRKGHLLV